MRGVACLPLGGCARVVLDRSPPHTPREPSVQVPTITRHSLAFGPELYLAQDQGLPLVAMAVGMRGGHRDDPPGKEGLAATIAALLLSSVGQPGDGADPYGDLGTTMLTSALPSLVLSRCTVHRDDAAAALQLLARRRSIHLSEAGFDRARRGRLDALDAVRGSPESIAALGLVLASDGAEPPVASTELGSPDTFAALAPVDAQAWLSTRERADGVVVAMAGDVDERDARAWIATAFAGWPSTTEPPPPLPPVVHRSARGPRVVLVRWPRLPQAVLAFGGPHPVYGHPDEPAHTVAGWIAGGIMHHELRSRQRTSYGMQWNVVDTKRGRVLAQWAKLEPVDIGRAVQRLRTRLLLMQSDVQLSDIALRDAWLHEMVGMMESFHGPEAALGELVRLMDERLPAEHPERRVRAFDDLEAPQVIHTLRTAYHPDLVRICIVGDDATLEHARRVLPARDIVERRPEQLLGLHGR
jgi:zinc protease